MRPLIVILGSALAILSSLSIEVYGQNAASGILPKITLTRKINNNWKVAGTLESRFPVVNDLSQFEPDPSYRLSDLSLAASRKTGNNLSLNFSYTLRLLTNETVHRQAIQLNKVIPFWGVRLAQRLGADITFPGNDPADHTFRLRYRMLAEIPLSGEAIDQGEFYFKPGTEFLGAFTTNSSEFENRVLIMTGYEINKKNRLEVGIDHRFTFHPEKERSHYSWLALAWFISL